MGLPELWEASWEVQFLLLSSLLLQLLLLILTESLRRLPSWPLLSAAPTAILWLLYQTADDVAIYALGHMSLSARPPRQQQQLMAFWASLLLVHLGGQDTITALPNMDGDDSCLPNSEGLDHRVENMVRLVHSMGSHEERQRQQRLVEAILVLSRYLMFLLVEKPRLLPGPFRNFICAGFKEFSHFELGDDILRPEVRLAKNLLARCEVEGVEEVLRAISEVWVEMLCYAASHCINNSHARQLCSGVEFITVVWIVTTSLFNRFIVTTPYIKNKRVTSYKDTLAIAHSHA